MKKTIFIDIDGVLIRHTGNLSNQFLNEPELLPGVLDKLNKWDMDGHKIILTTGRKKSMKKKTKKQLAKLGIFYDELIMGLNRGERILINDGKADLDIITATAIQIKRNEGLTDVNI